MFWNNVIINRPVMVQEKRVVNNRNIPEPMKREIRQRCGFGCVLCGSIIYDYDHMENDWADVREHVSNDITLLCPNHHREKTNNLISREQVVEANKKPFNIENGYSSPYSLNFSGGVAYVVIANNIFTNDSLLNIYGGQVNPFVIPILIDAVPVIAFKIEDEKLLLDITIVNEFNEPIFLVRDNQLVVNSEAWDVDMRGSSLIVREGHKKIVIEMEFCVPNKVIVKKAKIKFNGVVLDLKEDHYILNGKKSGVFSHNALSSLVGFSIGQTNRFPRGVIHIQKVKRCSNV